MRVLLRGITVPGVTSFAEEYLRRPFVGRLEALQFLELWLQKSHTPLLLCAEAGRGKSALLLRWAQQKARAGILVAWCPISLRFGTARSAILDEALYGRLQVLLPQEGVRHWTDQLRGWQSERSLVLIIDGLDEALDPGVEASLRHLGVPSGVRIIVATRRGVGHEISDWAMRLGWHDAAALPLGPFVQDKLRDLLGDRLDAKALARIYKVTGGDPLLVALHAEQGQVEGGGLQTLFDAWWQDQERAWQQRGEDLSEVTKALFRVLACAMGPLDIESLSRISSRSLTEASLAALGRFVVRTSEGYVNSHPRLNDFFREHLRAEERREVDLRICWTEQYYHGDFRGAGLKSPWAIACLSSLLRRQKALAIEPVQNLGKQSTPDADALDAITRLLPVLHAVDLIPWLDELSEKRPLKLRQHILYFFLLKDEVRYAARFLRDADPLARLSVWLRTLTSDETLRDLFCRDKAYDLHQRVPSYPWVVDGVIKLGRAWEYAQLMKEASLFNRLRVWHSLWPHLSTAQQEELRQDIFASCQEEQAGSQRERDPPYRCFVLPILSAEQTQILWLVDGAPSGLKAFPGAYYSRFSQAAITAAAVRVAAIVKSL